MPITSPEQFGAMQAALRGRSTKGIPKSVARRFIKETPEHRLRAFAKALARKRNGRKK